VLADLGSHKNGAPLIPALRWMAGFALAAPGLARPPARESVAAAGTEGHAVALDQVVAYTLEKSDA
jgi:hypothetical protein